MRPLDGWSLVQLGPRGEERVAIEAGGELRQLGDGLSMLELLDEWERWEPVLRSLDPAALDVASAERLAAPITYPRKLLCAGANYVDHVREMGAKPPSPDERPFFFLKPPTTTVVAPDSDVVVPGLSDADLDWEAELAVVIGRGGRDIARSEVHRHIAGYTVANDLSARGRFTRPDPVSPAFGWDWLLQKGLDSSCPLGPGIVPHWFVPDPQSLRIRLTVNGTVMQDSSTSDMIIDIEGLVSGASGMVTLEPGDVILTGTPAGVGAGRNLFLKHDDAVTAEVETIGVLRTHILDATRVHAQ